MTCMIWNLIKAKRTNGWTHNNHRKYLWGMTAKDIHTHEQQKQSHRQMNQLMLMIKLYVKLTQIKLFQQHKHKKTSSSSGWWWWRTKCTSHNTYDREKSGTQWTKKNNKFKWINFCGKSTMYFQSAAAAVVVVAVFFAPNVCIFTCELCLAGAKLPHIKRRWFLSGRFRQTRTAQVHVSEQHEPCVGCVCVSVYAWYGCKVCGSRQHNAGSFDQPQYLFGKLFHSLSVVPLFALLLVRELCAFFSVSLVRWH